MEAEMTDHLVGAHEIRMMLGGISRQRVFQLTSRATFPAPVADLAMGKVWSTDDVHTWVKTRRPQNVESCKRRGSAQNAGSRAGSSGAEPG